MDPSNIHNPVCPINHQPWITLVVLYPYRKENAVGIGKKNITKPDLQSLEDTIYYLVIFYGSLFHFISHFLQEFLQTYLSSQS